MVWVGPPVVAVSVGRSTGGLVEVEGAVRLGGGDGLVAGGGSQNGGFRGRGAFMVATRDSDSTGMGWNKVSVLC